MGCPAPLFEWLMSSLQWYPCDFSSTGDNLKNILQVNQPHTNGTFSWGLPCSLAIPTITIIVTIATTINFVHHKTNPPNGGNPRMVDELVFAVERNKQFGTGSSAMTCALPSTITIYSLLLRLLLSLLSSYIYIHIYVL